MRLRVRGWSKYRAKRTEAGGETFASKLEACRWMDLKTLERAGLISGLKRQIPYDLTVNGHLVCRYIADFVYTTTETAETTVEDAKAAMRCKGSKRIRLLPEFRLKAKLMEACHGIVVQVWTGRPEGDRDVNKGRWLRATRPRSSRTTSRHGASSRGAS